MELTRDLPVDQATRIIRAYAAGSITTSHETVTRSVVLAPDSIAEWAPTASATIAAADIEQLCALAPELIILGTGARLVFPPQVSLAPARAKRIGIEVMDTAAACRTYNLLVTDGRKVVAGLLMI
jgi:uncharacterized protein